MEKLSIIVPVYNVVKYIKECVDSLTNQDYNNLEIIIVDDGSTDGSGRLCDSLAEHDSRIRVIHQHNQGLSSARNTGLENASGTYIAFIDSDDYVAHNMFSTLIRELEKTHASVAICNFVIFNKSTELPFYRYGNEVIDYSFETQVKYYAAALDSSCNRVFRAKLIRDNNIVFEHKNIVAQEDYWFQLRAFSHIDRIVTIKDCLYHYRERGSSITKSHSDGDITNRNLHFYKCTEDYIRKQAHRNIERFMEYLWVNLFTASINNAPSTKTKDLLEILDQYKKLSIFKSAISENSINSIYPGSGIRIFYTRLTFCLLRLRLNWLYAILESMRLSRLRSNSRTSLYYE